MVTVPCPYPYIYGLLSGYTSLDVEVRRPYTSASLFMANENRKAFVLSVCRAKCARSCPAPLTPDPWPLDTSPASRPFKLCTLEAFSASFANFAHWHRKRSRQSAVGSPESIPGVAIRSFVWICQEGQKRKLCKYYTDKNTWRWEIASPCLPKLSLLLTQFIFYFWQYYHHK